MQRDAPGADVAANLRPFALPNRLFTSMSRGEYWPSISTEAPLLGQAGLSIPSHRKDPVRARELKVWKP